MPLYERQETTYCNIKIKTEDNPSPHLLVNGKVYQKISWQFVKIYFKDKEYEDKDTRKKTPYKEFNMILEDQDGTNYTVQWPMPSYLVRGIVMSLCSQTSLGNVSISVSKSSKTWYASSRVENDWESLEWWMTAEEQAAFIDSYDVWWEIIKKYSRLIDAMIPRASAIVPWVDQRPVSVPAQPQKTVSDTQTPAETEAMLQQHQADVEARVAANRVLKDDELPSDAQITRWGKTWKDKVKAMTKEYSIDEYCRAVYGYVFLDMSKQEMSKFLDMLFNTPSSELETIIKRTLHNPDDDDDFDPVKVQPAAAAKKQPVIEEDFSDLPF